MLCVLRSPVLASLARLPLHPRKALQDEEGVLPHKANAHHTFTKILNTTHQVVLLAPMTAVAGAGAAIVIITGLIIRRIVTAPLVVVLPWGWRWIILIRSHWNLLGGSLSVRRMERAFWSVCGRIRLLLAPRMTLAIDAVLLGVRILMILAAGIVVNLGLRLLLGIVAVVGNAPASMMPVLVSFLPLLLAPFLGGSESWDVV